MKKVDVMIFDLDGTLIDSKKDIAASVNYTMATLDLPPLSNELIYSFVGNGVTPLIEKSVLASGGYSFQQALQIFKDHYTQHLLDTTQTFEGILETLNHFQKKLMFVVTNKSQGYSDKIIKGLGLDHFFQGIFGGDTQFPKKPAPDVIHHILKKTTCPPDKAVLIGDSAVDIQTGKNAKILTCGVTYGFRPREEIEKSLCDDLIENPEELIKLFE